VKTFNIINHVAFIMDGNNRWSKKKKISNKEGYQKGLNKINEIIDLFLEKKIKFLTLFALSSENMKRMNVNLIFELISNNFDNFLKNISRNNQVKIQVFGNINGLPNKTKKIVQKIQKITKNNNQLILNIALNYGAKNELVYCFNNLFNKMQNSNIKITEKIIRDNLYLSNVPDPEILIRTGGFQRLSNFLLFQLSYTELFFTKTLWPDITKKEIISIFNKYKAIERKFGL